MKSDAPRFASFPVSPENVPTKHRAIFSSSFAACHPIMMQPASMPASRNAIDMSMTIRFGLLTI